MIEPFLVRLQAEGRIDVMVRVRPHAAKSEITSVLDDGSLKVSIAAPAEDGRGNTALIKLLAETFSVSISSVAILSGKAARLKLVRISAPAPR